MTLKECYQLLKVDQSASLEDVKRAYRRRAFELHPDLNPHVSNASRQFQLLNEAYVILTRLVSARESAEQRRQERPQEERKGTNWYDWGFSFGKKPETEERRAEREEAYREEMRREEARQREERLKEESRQREEKIREEARQREEKARKDNAREEQERAEQERAAQERREQERKAAQQATSRKAADSTGPQTEKKDAGPRPQRPGAADSNLYAEQQEVLRDILNDDFARRVFEDIYSEIRKKTPPPEREQIRPENGPERTVLRQNAESAQPPSPSKGKFSFGLEHLGLDFSKGMGNTVKGWLRSQIDEEQTIRLPAAGLFPGARVRLQIRRGLSDDLITLEVTLPQDFTVGKPIRLKGMGKKLGSVQGDLYLTLVAR